MTPLVIVLPKESSDFSKQLLIAKSSNDKETKYSVELRVSSLASRAALEQEPGSSLVV